jgi:beta-glucosidase-like glycosyl hydrolase
MASSPINGGKRSGAGRKPVGYELSQERADYELERALHEKSKRERSELSYKIESGQVVSRQAVQQASATALAVAAQSLRSLPDNLERKLGLSPQVAEQIELTIDAILTDLSLALQAMHTPVENHESD